MNARVLPCKQLVKLYTQSISAAEYAEALGKVGQDKKYFEDLKVMNTKLEKQDAERRRTITCQGCADLFARCLRESTSTGDFARKVCGGEFDSCVGNSEVIRKDTCLVAR